MPIEMLAVPRTSVSRQSALRTVAAARLHPSNCPKVVPTETLQMHGPLLLPKLPSTSSDSLASLISSKPGVRFEICDMPRLPPSEHLLRPNALRLRCPRLPNGISPPIPTHGRLLLSASVLLLVAHRFSQLLLAGLSHPCAQATLEWCRLLAAHRRSKKQERLH